MSIREQLDRCDLTLFRHIESQTTDNDRTALLALHCANAKVLGSFKYLEIGSHLGGSLQALVLDPACTQIISIDPRPILMPDNMNVQMRYEDNSTQRMRDLLQKIPGADLRKLHTLDSSTDKLKQADLPCRPDYCFIDGEHTDAAVLCDARFCLQAIGANGCLAFHDANMVYGGVFQFLAELRQQGREFRAYNLADVVFVIELGNCRLADTEPLRRLIAENYKGYLNSLISNNHFRETAQRYYKLAEHPVWRFLQKIGLVSLGKRLTGGRR